MRSLVLDEIYSFSSKKHQRCYVFTAVGTTDLGYRFFHARLYPTNCARSLRRFLAELPAADHYFSDGAPMYGLVLGTKVLQEKGAMTNLVESFNAQLRQYVPWLRRRTKDYGKEFESMQRRLDLVLEQMGAHRLRKIR